MTQEPEFTRFLNAFQGFFSRQREAILASLGVSFAVTMWGETYMLAIACGFAAGVWGRPSFLKKLEQSSFNTNNQGEHHDDTE